jgi:hypothetical protein
MNDIDKGQATVLIVESRDKKSYLGICYELALVLESDSEDALIEDMIEAARGYVSVVRKNNLPSDQLLNRSHLLPKKYKVLFEEFMSRVNGEKTQKLPKEYEEAFQTGRARLTLACA